MQFTELVVQRGDGKWDQHGPKSIGEVETAV